MNLKILNIGSDRNLFISGSEAQKRIKDYGTIFSELHIVVFADRKLRYSDIKLSENVFVYPTNHRFKFLYLWNIIRIVKRVTVKSQLSSVSCQDPFEAGIAGWLLKMLFKLPLQLQVHTDIFSPYFAAGSFGNRLRVLCAKFLLPRADGIRVVSERIKKSIQLNAECDMSKVVVLPVFVDVKKIQAAKVKINLHEKYPDFNFIALMASRLTKEKNINMAIEAMKSVVEKHAKALLLIIGNGPESESLKSKVKSLNLENNVYFESAVDSQALFSYYKAADVFLLTSNYEGYGRTVIEAMAAGLPVIMTDVGIANELLIDDLDGIVIPVGDTRALSDAINTLHGSPEIKEGFIRSSTAAIGTFPDKKEYLDSYKKTFIL